ncbi:hypothetical protein OE88DRAFT_1090156 [Heliocybe sulcata]|uniref:F-box domain-containing protein n=1 Tax=Heliocybe sulcata TaxID=5364 RepID=A0A5C3MWA7_9AGAM|nr:hypothetical protein OE88DRAFT_1090156 [Heliocybe sulcata]
MVVAVDACDECFGACHGLITTPVRVFTPLVLSQICRLWRQCAHATARLWCSVLIRQGPDPPDLSKKDVRVYPNLLLQTAFLNTYVTRARALPMNLTFQIHQSSDDVDASLDIWRSSMSRCQSLYVNCPDTIWDQLFYSPIELPLLEKLGFAIWQRQIQTPVLLLNSLAMPKLKQLEIALWGVNDTPDGVDWSQLSTLAIHCYI